MEISFSSTTSSNTDVESTRTTTTTTTTTPPVTCEKMEDCWKHWIATNCHEKYQAILVKMFAREGYGVLPSKDWEIMERIVLHTLARVEHRETLAKMTDKWHSFHLALIMEIFCEGERRYRKGGKVRYTHSLNLMAFSHRAEDHQEKHRAFQHVDLSALFDDPNQLPYQNFLSWLWYVYDELGLKDHIHALCLNERGYNAFRSIRFFLDVDRVDKKKKYLEKDEGMILNELLDPLIKETIRDMGLTEKQVGGYSVFKRESRGTFHVVFQKLVWCPSTCASLEKDSTEWDLARNEEGWTNLFRKCLAQKVRADDRAKKEFVIDDQCTTNISMPYSFSPDPEKKPPTSSYLPSLVPGKSFRHHPFLNLNNQNQGDHPTERYVYKRPVNPKQNPFFQGTVLCTACIRNPYSVSQAIKDGAASEKRSAKKRDRRTTEQGEEDDKTEDRTEDDATDEMASSRKKSRRETGRRMAPDPNGREATGEYYWSPFDLYAERPAHGRDLMLLIRKEYEQSSAYGTGNEEEVYEEAVCNVLNRHFAVLERGPAAILRRRYRADNDANVLEFDDNWKKMDFFSNYSNIFLPVEKKDKETGKKSVKKLVAVKVWWDSVYRRQYVDLVFCPYPQGHPNYLKPGQTNSFCGWRWTVDELRSAFRDPRARRGAALLQRHVFYVICDGDREKFQWLMFYFTKKIREPWCKPCCCPVFNGNEGSGKRYVDGTRISYFTWRRLKLEEDV